MTLTFTFEDVDPPQQSPLAALVVVPDVAGNQDCPGVLTEAGYTVAATQSVALRAQMVDRVGNPIPIAAEDNLKAAVVHAVCRNAEPKMCTIQKVEGAQYLVDIKLPESISKSPGIYRGEIAKCNEFNAPVHIQTFVLAVEPSLFAPNYKNSNGTILLRDIRIRMRDLAAGDQLSAGFQFSTDELISALLWPVNRWNEIPGPPSLSPESFVFRSQWLDATVGRLFAIMGDYQMVNGKRVTYEGAAMDDREKYLALQQRSLQLIDAFDRFVVAKKREISRMSGMRRSGGFGG